MSDLILGLTGVMRSEIESLDVIAQNTANLNSPGYKSQHAILDNRNFVSQLVNAEPILIKRSTNTDNGVLNMTGASLDFALVGEGWFAVQHAEGIALTRNGNFRIDAQNQLVTQSGDPVLGSGREPITLTGKNISLAGNEIVDNSTGESTPLLILQQLPGSSVTSLGNSLYLTADPEEQTTGFRIVQGAREQSNVDPASDLVRLMQTTRHIESIQRAITTYNELLNVGINQLGK